jgi:REP-associated tyrosine transposase
MHSFTSILIHCVWSTKKREPFLSSDVRNRLWPYLGGIARENKIKALAIGGVADHVHMLISLPKTLSVSKALQLLKGNSSKWIHDTFPKFHSFEWQEGYGAFSVGISAVHAVHLRPGGAPSKAIVSRGVRGHASATWLGLRRADARLILPSLPGLVSLLTF